MKKFAIFDMVSNKPLCIIPAANGKSALNKFKMRLMSRGFYEIHKESGNWVLSSTYGAYFRAIETY